MTRLPEAPDPTVIANSGAEAVKSLGKGVVGAGMDIAEGLRTIIFQSVEGSAKTVDRTVRDVVAIIRSDVETGKSTIENVRREVDQACNSALGNVDRAIGQEVVRKFKNEVERQLR